MTVENRNIPDTLVTSVPADQADTLRPSLGALRLIFLIIAAAAPMAAVLGVVPIAFAFGNGTGVPLTFAGVAIILGLFTVGYNAMSKEVVNVGAFYAYIARGFGSVMGLGSAFLAVLSYTVFVCGVVGYVAFFTKVALSDVFGINVHWIVPAIGAVALAAILGYRQIDFSSRMLAILLAVEFAVLIALNVSIVWSKGTDAFPTSVFSLNEVFSGAPGIAIMLAFTCFIGVESAALYSEETHSPSRSIGLATFGAVLLTALFYFATTWITVGAVGSDVKNIATDQLANLYFNLGDLYLSKIATHTMELFLSTSMFATLLAIHNVASRYIFALGRQGCLPSFLGRVHPVHASPHAASVLITLISATVVVITFVIDLDPLLGLGAVGIGFGTVGIIALQALTSLAIIAYFRRKGRIHWWRTLTAPIASFIGLTLAVSLAVKNFDLLTGSKSQVVILLPCLLVLAFIIGGLYAVRLKKSHPDVYFAIARSLNSKT
ncbi:UNVERIFIED_ORG: amino acid transporter [Pseudomonas putida]|nr:amino acid transporter [Pseudomonas putida]